MGLKESLKKLQEAELRDKTLSLKREVKKELTALKNEKISQKKCIACNEDANYSIKGSNEFYCKDCAIEYFGDLKHLKKLNKNSNESNKSSKEIYFITSNNKKFLEIKTIIPEIQKIEIDLIEIQELDAKKIIEHKLMEAKKRVKESFIVEDTSLYIKSLNNLPGPFIKFFLKQLGDSGIYNLIEKNIDKSAEARTLIGLYHKGKIKYFQGIIKGKIVYPKTKTDFGWDSIFIPDGYTQTFSEMELEDKNEISMRGIASQKLKEYLNSK